MSKVNIYAGLTAEQKEAIMAARNDQSKVIDTGKGQICWKVGLADCLPFTYITEQARTVEQVEDAILEKFCRPAVSVVRL